MASLRTIISRGAHGPELAALQIARVFGVLTAGQTRLHHDPRQHALAIRYGLCTDACTRHQALLSNIRRSDATLIFGPLRNNLEQRILVLGKPCFPVRVVLNTTSDLIARWIEHHGIERLKVIGDPARADEARKVLFDVMLKLGFTLRTPEPGSYVFHDAGNLYAARLWPHQKLWIWHDPSATWRRRRSWRHHDLIYRRQAWSRIPRPIRDWVTQDSHLDVPLLEAFTQLGRSAHDLARAERWSFLRLFCYASDLLPKPLARWNRLRRLARCKLRDIAAHFGFERTETTVRILSRLPLADISQAVLIRLRVLLRDPRALRMLQQLPSLCSPVVEILSEPSLRRALTPQLIHRLSGELFPGIGLLEELRKEAVRTGWLSRLPKLRSRRALLSTIEMLKKLPDEPVVPPPASLPEIDKLIECLPDAAALAEEGRAMQHCVGTFAPAVESGAALVFRILPDTAFDTERATLHLEPDRGGQWRIRQLLGPLNRPVSEATARVVRAWLFYAHRNLDGSGYEIADNILDDMLASPPDAFFDPAPPEARVIEPALAEHRPGHAGPAGPNPPFDPHDLPF